MTPEQLREGVGHLRYEWTQLAGCAGRLAQVDGIRTPEQNAALEALLLHARCLINFLCGNYRGQWDRRDMRPADFVRRPWVLPDEEMDRRLRGRLSVINPTIAHVSWDRVTNQKGVIWPAGLVAHEVHWSMKQFVRSVEDAEASTADLWSAAASEADRWMPDLRSDWMELRGFEPAPIRASTEVRPVDIGD